VIKKVFGVSSHPGHCRRLLQELKSSPQKPKKLASQRDEAAIQAWKEQRWEEVKKKPKRKSAPSSL